MVGHAVGNLGHGVQITDLRPFQTSAIGPEGTMAPTGYPARCDMEFETGLEFGSRSRKEMSTTTNTTTDQPIESDKLKELLIEKHVEYVQSLDQVLLFGLCGSRRSFFLVLPPFVLSLRLIWLTGTAFWCGTD